MTTMEKMARVCTNCWTVPQLGYVREGGRICGHCGSTLGAPPERFNIEQLRERIQTAEANVLEAEQLAKDSPHPNARSWAKERLPRLKERQWELRGYLTWWRPSAAHAVRV